MRSIADDSRIAALDGLRGVAVLAVVLAHNMPWTTGDSRTWFYTTALAPAGVRLFFVLSGYLITRTLLESRTVSSDVGRGAILKRFYIRRLLRLTPVYYGTLIFGGVLGFAAVREAGIYYALYLSNIFTAVTGIHHRGFAHFWSLAIEEQFYLFWPLLVVFLTRASLRRVGIGLVVLALGLRWWLFAADQPLAAYMLMPARLDALGVGALCAIAEATARAGWRLLFGGLSVVAALALAEWTGLAHGQIWHINAAEVASVLFDAGLVVVAAHGTRSILTDVFTLSPMIGLGRISYAVYVFHFLVPELYTLLAQAGGPRLLPELHGGPRLLIVAIPTIGLAVASWYLIERPIGNYYRHRWTYGRPQLAPYPLVALPESR
jgi:peptidoglycan/LPS O-acetylase OafA/YrhL